MDMVRGIVGQFVDMRCPNEKHPDTWDLAQLRNDIHISFGVKIDPGEIHTLGSGEMNMAVNFDKERNEPTAVLKFTKAAAETKTLVIDKVVMHKTPQSAEYYLCLEATVGDKTKRFNIPNKTYEGTETTIPTDLTIENARPDQACQYVLKLDDVAGDEITDEMDNKSTGSFPVSSSGSQTFKPEDGWSYTIYWHLK